MSGVKAVLVHIKAPINNLSICGSPIRSLQSNECYLRGPGEIAVATCLGRKGRYTRAAVAPEAPNCPFSGCS